MSERDLKLRVVFAALDKITAPLKKIAGQSSATANALKATTERIKHLQSQQKEVDYLRKQQQAFRDLSAELRTAKLKVNDASDAMQDMKMKQANLVGGVKSARLEFKSLQTQMLKTHAPTAQLSGQFALARDRLSKLEGQYNTAKNSSRRLTQAWKDAGPAVDKLKNKKVELAGILTVTRDRMKAAGISTHTLAKAQTWLKDSTVYTNNELADQQKKLAAVTRQQERIAGARQHAERARTAAGNLAGAGAGATAAGAAIGMPLFKAIGEAKHYELEKLRVNALGLGEHVSKDSIKFANGMKTYGTSTVENLGLMRDALTVFADEHHAKMVTPTLAKMKFANSAVFGEEAGAENERKFMNMLKVIEMRGGLASEKAFIKQADMVQKVITATGGRVGPNEWLNVIKTGGVAAKGIKDESFYYQMEPMVQEMGGNRVGTAMMSAYQNIYQGKTTKRAANNLDAMGLIADHGKVTHDKVGQVAQLGVGALAGSDLFRENQFEWMEKILLPKLAAKGITEKNAVLDTIGGLFSNRTASNLFAQMYLQREQIHKNAKLNAGADGITDLNNKAMNLPQGQELEGLAKMHDLQKNLGEKVLPLYIQGLQLATRAAQGLTAFMQEHPTLAKAIAVSFGVLAAILLILGPLMLAMAALIGPYAMLHVLFAKMGISGGVLTPILRGIGGSFMWLGRAALWLGRAFLMNPIGLAVTAIGVSVWAIYTYWGPIKEFFSGLWDGVVAVFNTAWGGIKTFASGLWTDIQAAFSSGILGVGALILNWSPLDLFYQAFSGVMSWFGIDMPAKFTEFGANIMGGLINGITGALGWVKATISGAGDSVIGWFKDKLGIHSPSRVFADLGDFTMQGLAMGLQRSEDAPLSQVSSMAKRLTQLGAGIAIGAAAMPAMAFDTRPPIAPYAAGNGMVVHGDTIQITIQAAPGMDENAIARAVAAALDQRDRQKAARLRSSLHDY